MCDYRDIVVPGRLSLAQVADMNDIIDVRLINEHRIQAALTRNKP